ncbi:thiamine-phosphate kinase [Actinomyces respiraculi]|uniref:thiamine-phosphate kinase n=1 Tax=Actinomyces respiraculi TaxID=2744574 RepID=UPI001F398E3C|nr:thiamine-phosphate kinase [Actinomyces respiraculi]
MSTHGSTAAPGPLVGDLDESELLTVLTPPLPASPLEVVGNGDDGAVLAAPDGRYVVSTDVLVEGRHFRTDWSTPEQVGRRAAAQNLADVMGMGARPTAMVVSLVLPGSTPVAWVRGLASGLGQTCRWAGAGVVGGDLSAGDAVVIAVTVHGDLEGRPPVLRSGARPGDLLVHAGDLGASRAGLALLSAGLDPQSLPADGQARRCIERFLTPVPPLEAGPALAAAGASAMMDVSDSLLRDCGRIAAASGVLIDIDDPADEARGAQDRRLAGARVALEPVAALAGEADPAAAARGWVLTGGEDHGLLATVPPGTVLPAGVSVIGRVHDPLTAPGVLVGSRPWGGPLGWDHFRA